MPNPFNNVIEILEKGKCTLHTIACLTVFLRAFCHTRIENLLKGLVYIHKVSAITSADHKVDTTVTP